MKRVSMDWGESEMGEIKTLMSKKWYQNVFEFVWALNALVFALN